MSKAIAAAALVALSLLCFGALASGSELVSALVLGLLPAGNALMWAGLLGFSGAALLLSARSSFMRRLSLVVFALACAWLPASSLLAGNLALNFSGELGSYWLVGSLGLVALVVATLIASAAAAAYHRIKGPRAA